MLPYILKRNCITFSSNLWKNLKLQSQLGDEYPIDKEETRNRNFKPSMIQSKEIEEEIPPAIAHSP